MKIMKALVYLFLFPHEWKKVRFRRQENLLDTVCTICDEGLELRQWQCTWIPGEDRGGCLEVEFEAPFGMIPFNWAIVVSLIYSDCLLCISLRWLTYSGILWKSRIVSCITAISKTFGFWIINTVLSINHYTVW